MRVFYTLLLAVLCFAHGFSTNYYSKSTGALNVLGTWGTATNGTGTAPANFTTAGNTFIIVNNTAPTITANWTISGTGSKAVVGDGTQLINFIIPSGFRYTGTADVAASATLTIQNTTNPTLGTLASGSTVAYSATAAQTVLGATYYNLTLGGSGNKSQAATATTVSNILNIGSGIAYVLSTTNTITTILNGTITGAGTITGGTNSNLTIGGTGPLGTFNPTGGAQTLRAFIINRTSAGTVTLGGNITAGTTFTHTNGIIDLNGHLLTINGVATFPVASSNGSLSGSATSSLSIGATTITNNLYLTSGAQTLSSFVINSSGQTLVLGTDMTVGNTYTQTRGIIDLNGKTLTLNGAATFASTAANGTTSGSSGNLILNATGITNSLFMTTGNQTVNNLTLNAAGKTLTLGTALTVAGDFTQTNGILALNGQTLSLNGTATFPAASTNGTITGSTASTLSVSTSSISNNIYFTTAAQTLKTLALNNGSSLLNLGTNLTVGTIFTHTGGLLGINGNLLTLNGSATFPASSSMGSITGSSTSSLTIGATTLTNAICFTAGSQTLKAFVFNAATPTLKLGTDLTVGTTYTQTRGIVDLNGKTLTLNGAVTFASTAANGTTSGSSGNLLLNATAITNSLFMTTGKQTLNNLTLNAAGKTLTLGTALTVAGAFTQTNGIIKLNNQTLTLSGTATFPAASSNGTITGSATSGLSVSASSIANNLFFTTGSTSLGTFVLNSGAATLNLGTALTVATTFTHSSGKLGLNGQFLTLNSSITFPTSATNGSISGSTTSSLTIGGTTAVTNSMFMDQTSQATSSLNSLTMNRASRTLTLGNNLNITNVLTPTTGTVSAGGNLTIIASAPTVMGRIGTMSASGAITGNVTMQAYAKGGTTGWTTMGSPGLTGRTFADWNDDFTITCLNCPNGYNVGGSNFCSIDGYSETAGGLFSAAPRYIDITNTTDAMTIGKGYWVYLGNSTTTTSDIVIDVTGPVNQQNFTYNLTITNSGGGTNTTDHGYNLLANCYPSAINWTSLRNGNTKVANAIYVYNPDLGDYATYVNGVSSPVTSAGGIGNLIPAGQAFYVKVSAATTLVAKESYKSASTQPLLKTASTQSLSAQHNLLRLNADGNAMHSETVLYFDQGPSVNYDFEYDALSMGAPAPGYLNIASVSYDTAYAINGLPQLNTNMSVPLKIITGTTTSYSVWATDFTEVPAGACINIYDKYTHVTHDLRTGPFICTLNDTETVARFLLNITIDPTLQVNNNTVNPSCSKSGNGYIVAQGAGSGPYNYYWKDANGNIIKTTLNTTSADTLKNLNAGAYSVDVNTAGMCDNGALSFTLDANSGLSSGFNPSATTAQIVTDSVQVSFTNSSVNADQYWWDFGDGMGMADNATTTETHAYTAAGDYSVTLFAINSACGDTVASTQVVTITMDTSSVSGIAASSYETKNMFISRDAEGYYVQFNYPVPVNAVISVRNLLGQDVTGNIIVSRATNNKIYILLDNLESNVLVLTVTTSSGDKAYHKLVR